MIGLKQRPDCGEKRRPVSIVSYELFSLHENGVHGPYSLSLRGKPIEEGNYLLFIRNRDVESREIVFFYDSPDLCYRRNFK